MGSSGYMTGLRLVLDTNVLLSALLFPHRIVVLVAPCLAVRSHPPTGKP